MYYYIYDMCSSHFSTPQEDILQSFKDDNLQLFSDLINEENVNLNHEYTEENHSTLLHLCLMSGKVNFVQELVRCGANLNLPHKV